MMRVARCLAALIAMGSLTACAGLINPPQPWEKSLLAKPEMTMDSDGLEAQFTQHILGSKEGSSGGYGVGGGGCGCN
ncbi:lipoprotein [Aquabacterium sp. NJ1]|nr:lipoprotein [Aquabacterium sp. NJ1]